MDWGLKGIMVVCSFNLLRKALARFCELNRFAASVAVNCVVKKVGSALGSVTGAKPPTHPGPPGGLHRDRNLSPAKVMWNVTKSRSSRSR